MTYPVTIGLLFHCTTSGSAKHFRGLLPPAPLSAHPSTPGTGSNVKEDIIIIIPIPIPFLIIIIVIVLLLLRRSTSIRAEVEENRLAGITGVIRMVVTRIGVVWTAVIREGYGARLEFYDAWQIHEPRTLVREVLCGRR